MEIIFLEKGDEVVVYNHIIGFGLLLFQKIN